MDKVYEAVKKVLDKHCDQQLDTDCDDTRKRSATQHIPDICWICKKHESLAIEISREVHDNS